MKPDGKLSREVGDLANRLVQKVTEEVQKTILSLKEEDRGIVEATFVAAMGSMGALQILSGIIGKATGGTMTADAINPVSTLFGALLAAKMGAVVEQDGEFTKVKVPFGPEVLVETLEATERLLGRRPDDDLSESMIEFLRKQQKAKSSGHMIASSTMQ